MIVQVEMSSKPSLFSTEINFFLTYCQTLPTGADAKYVANSEKQSLKIYLRIIHVNQPAKVLNR